MLPQTSTEEIFDLFLNQVSLDCLAGRSRRCSLEAIERAVVGRIAFGNPE
jgi:hypothetical protein